MPGHAAREEARHRGGVDDMAAWPALLHPRHEGGDAVDRPAEVDAQHPVPIGIARFVDRPEQVDAGIVEQQADRAEPCLDLVRRLGEAACARSRRAARPSPRDCRGWRAPPRSNSSRISAIATLQPWSSSARASPSPMPLAPPVTKAVRPARSFMASSPPAAPSPPGRCRCGRAWRTSAYIPDSPRARGSRRPSPRRAR